MCELVLYDVIANINHEAGLRLDWTMIMASTDFAIIAIAIISIAIIVVIAAIVSHYSLRWFVKVLCYNSMTATILHFSYLTQIDQHCFRNCKRSTMCFRIPWSELCLVSYQKHIGPRPTLFSNCLKTNALFLDHIKKKNVLLNDKCFVFHFYKTKCFNWNLYKSKCLAKQELTMNSRYWFWILCFCLIRQHSFSATSLGRVVSMSVFCSIF